MRKWYIILAVFLCLFLGGAVVFWNSPPTDTDENVKQISYIYRGNLPEESQQALKQGLEQASNDLKVEITTVAPNNSSSVQEQLELIQKEMDNGADAILLEPINDKQIAHALIKVKDKIPVIEVNAAIEGEKNADGVYTDHVKMGAELARVVMKKMKQGETVTLLKYGMEYHDVKNMYQSAVKCFQEEGFEVVEVQMGSEERSRELSILAMMKNSSMTHVVAFESKTLELLGKVKKAHSDFSRVNVYGMGKTNQIISYIEDGTIQSIGVSNEYSIGYLSAQKAIWQLEGKVGKEKENKKKIGFSIIDATNIYTTKNQRLLFPFVQ